MSDSFVPNSFQVPNAYIDQFAHLLTTEEFLLLTYFCRRIFGFGKSSDRISLTQLTGGIVTREGKRLDHGTGMNRVTVMRALNGLLRAGLIEVVEPADKARHVAASYALQLNADAVDLEWLEYRREAQRDADRIRHSHLKVM